MDGAGEHYRARAHPSRPPEGGREDPLPRRRSRSRARSSPRRPGPASRSEKVCYNAGYTNVHELIPWRTLTGRQQFYQDHPWMRAFGEALCVYRPPSISRRSSRSSIASRTARSEIVLNFITPHQKWGIHSTYTDNLLMLTLSAAGRSCGSARPTPARPGSPTTTGSRSSTSTARWWRARW